MIKEEFDMKTITGQKFDEERALYGSRGVHLKGCAFDGPADGESALKESSDIIVEGTLCNLRYPFITGCRSQTVR